MNTVSDVYIWTVILKYVCVIFTLIHVYASLISTRFVETEKFFTEETSLRLMKV